MTKSELRRLYRQHRRALSQSEWEARSEGVAQQFFRWLATINTHSLVIHSFIPIERQNEVDTWRIIHRLWQDYPQVQVAASVTHPETATLTHYKITRDTPFRLNTYGIPEPPENPLFIVHYSLLDIVLVPLLTFDQQGHRVGYGGGYYDRFLALCRPDCRKVGLSLFEPVERIQDVYEGDIPLDVCLTPEQIWTYRGKPPISTV